MTREEAIKMLEYLATDTEGSRIIAADKRYAEFLHVVVDALDMAISALREQESLAEKQATSDWISVAERLPEHGDLAVCFTRMHTLYILQWDDVVGCWNYGTHASFKKNYITHWMSIPEPQKGD